MSIDQPYNSLGQVLSEGGEITLGLAYYFGYEPGRIAMILSKRLGPLTEDDQNKLIDLSQRGVDAGVTLREADKMQDIPLSQVPINPFLFGEQSEGGRILVIGEVDFGEGHGLIQVRDILEDTTTISEALDRLKQKGIGIGEKYPKKFGFNDGEPVDAEAARIIFAERRF